ncbi:2Fe-2S iron-sulfur cluster binding domain-containing protein [Marinobacter salinexigens]|uniref:2Fe-2S iron-sulfur cluster binding domain-containing protein n=1 Tax=Marinobacter salinexigens TaxID=2919747 RepID=A0A5B0V9Y1_9GAMM|nr:2Fe-2S iron-sulfur cluster binding domain-containing protein [Marinobacter salinexigens]KAA1171003.1 2Fe-2S iron-sulfur cluster binding domain-containing protein [Marinobacter salinexigens]
MFSLFSKRSSKPHYADINGRRLQVEPKETLLHAALREDINFPHSCRVGGCATCKCRLLKGKVRELTDVGYILSDDELDQGYILACQSVPTSDVTIEVDLSAQSRQTKVAGRIILQEQLTHDITHLKIRLQDSIEYKSGQYANLQIQSLPEVSRSYSFATPPSPDATVSFFIRKVPGGTLSTHINLGNLVGTTATVEGPLGDFWLRPSNAPLLMIAGGSGLAPILAILQDMKEQQILRQITLLFGARTQNDLYALQDIQELSNHWGSSFRFIPVLSDEAADTGWRGNRGWVTDILPSLNIHNTHAYLCGPPGMIDSAEQLLMKSGVDRRDIHADRFLTIGDSQPQQASVQAAQ